MAFSIGVVGAHRIRCWSAEVGGRWLWELRAEDCGEAIDAGDEETRSAALTAAIERAAARQLEALAA